MPQSGQWLKRKEAKCHRSKCRSTGRRQHGGSHTADKPSKNTLLNTSLFSSEIPGKQLSATTWEEHLEHFSWPDNNLQSTAGLFLSHFWWPSPFSKPTTETLYGLEGNWIAVSTHRFKLPKGLHLYWNSETLILRKVRGERLISWLVQLVVLRCGEHAQGSVRCSWVCELITTANYLAHISA